MSVPDIPDRVVEYSFACDEIPLVESQIVEALGYSVQGCPEPVRTAVRESISEAGTAVDIHGGYRILPDEAVFHADGRIECGPCRFESDKIITGQMKRASRVAVFAVTIGDKLETLARAMLSGDDPVKGYILDTVASTIADGAAERLQARLQKDAAEWGLKITNRYSPGYCGWSVAQQHILFAQLPAGFLGITLTDTALMHPIKSVSGIIGLGPDVRLHPYPCDFCRQPDCYMRRRRPTSAAATA